MIVRYWSLALPHAGAAVTQGDDVRGLTWFGGDATWTLLADSPANQGVSVTNGALQFTRFIADRVGVKPDQVRWYYRDSMGRFDGMAYRGEILTYYPLETGGKPVDSREALIDLLEVESMAVRQGIDWALSSSRRCAPAGRLA
jgi:hypothetical protein